jgi:hypothetical protein
MDAPRNSEFSSQDNEFAERLAYYFGWPTASSQRIY